MLSVTFQGASLAECEEKIVAEADAIRDRQAMREQGCTCKQTGPLTDARGWPTRCHGNVAVCLARKERLGRLNKDMPEHVRRIAEAPACADPVIWGPSWGVTIDAQRDTFAVLGKAAS